MKLYFIVLLKYVPLKIRVNYEKKAIGNYCDGESI